MKITNLYKNCAYGDAQLDISFAGCGHRCNGCYVPELQDPTMYPDWSPEYIHKEIDKLEPHVKGFVLLGGDPLYDDNVDDAISLIKYLTKFDKPITMLTGYTEQEIKSNDRRSIASSLCDKVLAGRYVGQNKQEEI